MMTMLRRLCVLYAALTVVTGIGYPLLVTGIAALAFRDQAHGSIVTRADTPVGSALLGQAFSAPGYFWSRLSGTTPQPFNGAASTGTNFAATNPALALAARARIAALQAADPGNVRPVPIDLVTASGSGLDPHISPAAAEWQVARVARARALAPSRVRALVAAHTQGRTFGILGEARVNVLELNLSLDSLH